MARYLARSVAVVLLSLAISGTCVCQVKADRIIVHKKEHTMELMHAGTVIKSYKIALGRNPVGPKQREGDFRTPEGVYVIDRRNAKSEYHRSLHFPIQMRMTARELVNSTFPRAGDVMIHGLPNGYGYLGAAHRRRDWTYGCIAVTDEEIDEIWSLVDNGTPIEILPSNPEHK